MRNAETTGRGTFTECKENSFSHNEKKIIEEKIWLQEKQREKGSRERDKINPFDGDGKDKVKSCP